jgi:NADPH:quinone reductase-like Zn-dependent oxidoreductase
VIKAAGIRAFGGAIETLDLPAPRALRPDEVRIAVRAAGVGNWDEFVRAGSWDVGVRPPMALGVEASGVVTAAGEEARGFDAGTLVAVHSAPLREQGSWATEFIAPAGHVAAVPPGISAEAAAAAPVPLLTADQAVADAARVTAGQTLLVHGAGGVTGGIIVQLAVHYGARVIATAGPASADRVRELGASTVVDYHQSGWPDRTRELTGGVDAAVNAAVNGERDALAVVRDGGRLATITGNPPPASRGITIIPVLVIPNGARLSHLLQLLAEGVAGVAVGFRYGLGDAAAALDQIHHGTHGTAVVVRAA